METYKKVMWGSMAAAFLLAALLAYLFFIRPVPAPPPAAEPVIEEAAADRAAPAPGVVEGMEEEPVQVEGALDVPLNDSDGPVRGLIGGCSSHPFFLRWLNTGNIARQCAAIVDNVARGESPAIHLRFLQPYLAKGFAVVQRNGDVFIGPGSYRRYDAVAAALTSVETDALVRSYRRLSPLLEKAFRELGYPGKTFHQTLLEAIDVLLDTPVPGGDIRLEEKVASYAFADSRLESLNDAQKHLLRMGPANTRRIQAALRSFKKALYD
jgi:hypothetical protein